MKCSPFKVWIWSCPLPRCTAHGDKPVTHRKAQHYGRWHLINRHQRGDLQPDLVKTTP